jgi:HlyD family secretion protein
LLFSYTNLEKGMIEATISSTGTLEAINTIQVGTQISGTISKIYVDYNDKVHQGDLLARIDVRLLAASLTNATANLAVLEAKLHQAEDEYHRNEVLFQKKVITEKEFKDSQYLYEQTQSSRDAAKASLQSAKVNLNYAFIRSPISGTITERSVEEGQTVAASFATPTLFIIAENLSNMQILADVDESDIGYIREEMQVRFTVQTYPERKFFGKVSQIRLQPVKVNNVVNYQVVVNVNNKDGLLLPGMTANLDFISESAQNVLLVNNSALRFHPNGIMLKQVMPVLLSKARQIPVSINTTFTSAMKIFETTGFRKILPQKLGVLFFQNSDRTLNCEFVRLGITTGLQSEIKSVVSGKDLPEGTAVINGIKTKEN